MIYPPSQRSRPRDQTPVRELAVWVVVMSALAATVLLIAGTQPPFLLGGSPTATPQSIDTPEPWTPSSVLLPQSPAGAIATATAEEAPEQLPGVSTFDQLAPAAGAPASTATAFSFPFGNVPTPTFGYATAPSSAGPQLGRPLPSATSLLPTMEYATSPALATPSFSTPGSAYP